MSPLHSIRWFDELIKLFGAHQSESNSNARVITVSIWSGAICPNDTDPGMALSPGLMGAQVTNGYRLVAVSAQLHQV